MEGEETQPRPDGSAVLEESRERREGRVNNNAVARRRAVSPPRARLSAGVSRARSKRRKRAHTADFTRL